MFPSLFQDVMKREELKSWGVGENVFDLLTAGFRVLRSPINPGPDKAIIVTLARLYLRNYSYLCRNKAARIYSFFFREVKREIYQPRIMEVKQYDNVFYLCKE
jgi:hypothetical protein